MDVSRSGRIRKKSSKLADFESDDVDSSAKKPAKSVSNIGRSSIGSSSYMIDSVPPDQILAGESDDDDIGTVSALREDDLDAIPDFEVEEEINVEDEDEEAGNLMIDEKPRRSSHLDRSKKSGSVSKRKSRIQVTPYLLFAKANRNKVATANPGMDFAGISAKIATMWSTLSTSDRQNWKRKLQRSGLGGQQQHLQNQHKSGGHSYGKTTSAQYMNPGVYKVTGVEPLDAAAHLKLLGESLSVIGQKLSAHRSQIAVAGSLSVLLDSLLCAMAPLVCLTKTIPELRRAVQHQKLQQTLDNVAYIMPGL